MAKADKLIKEKRERYLKSLIQEAVLNVLAEQEDDMAGSSVPPSPVSPAPETNQPSNNQPPAPEQEQSPQTPQEFTVDVLVEKLNVLRGGKSFTDPEIYGKLTTFFKNLTPEQKTSLDYLLTEMGKIVIGAEEQEAGLQHGQQQKQSPSGQSQPPSPTSPPPQAAAPQAPTAAPISPAV